MHRNENTREKKLFIAVIGGGQCTPEIYREAEIVGKELARHGVVLVCGGLGGVMEAACRGASMEGGVTVGILPGGEPTSSNPYVQIPVATSLGEARNIAVVKSTCAVIAIDGEYGTLSEIAFALKNHIPVVGLNTWKLSKNGQEMDAIVEAKNGADAVEKALRLAKQYISREGNG